LEKEGVFLSNILFSFWILSGLSYGTEREDEDGI